MRDQCHRRTSKFTLCSERQSAQNVNSLAQFVPAVTHAVILSSTETEAASAIGMCADMLLVLVPAPVPSSSSLPES
ncbi:hypothetical protein Mp_3g24950 [Marchantia polymorpha subsp. ruderalis]|uniref:Uncharacterized protein n=2 Tax=Marchantia polymorpha TaxID=3197 RepID=A0AAF6B4I2_MARPO|nr:hypothetical protein MARPO_0100s0008 [Marchantia polymorpha]BBN06916.1 hypothetical protein Mp_3g24950 [Marchantia polymorpha subsp. ruderalis]|eukprot:PTQ32293.1 hypothetical protein MARPO_0100s0008 [Marchantia polymorpha]